METLAIAFCVATQSHSQIVCCSDLNIDSIYDRWPAEDGNEIQCLSGTKLQKWVHTCMCALQYYKQATQEGKIPTYRICKDIWDPQEPSVSRRSSLGLSPSNAAKHVSSLACVAD